MTDPITSSAYLVTDGSISSIRFAIRVKPSASFASCSVTTSTGPIVPTIERLVCNEDKSIVWSLQPVGNSMFLSIWWDYSSQESLYGGEHFDPVSIKKVTLDDGSVVESYVGPTNYTLPTAPTTWEPLALNGLE